MAQSKSALLTVGSLIAETNHLAQTPGKPVHFQLTPLKRSHLLITGASGSGKSYFERVIAEQVVARVQTFIIDPEGEYITLREKFPFLLVGEGGEVPIHPHAAAVLAERLMQMGVSAIFDLSSMKVHDQHIWVANFIHALMQMRPQDTHDVVILIDEAHLFCPEKGEGESVAKNDMVDMASRGRKRGYTNIWATQRLAKLDKNAASELQNTCIGRTFIINDRERAAKILGISQRSAQREDFFRTLKVLPQGVFYGQGVAISPDIITFHVLEAQTRHPDPSERSSRRIVVPTPKQLQKLIPALASIPVEAEKREATEKELRQTATELRKQLIELQKEMKEAKANAAPAKPAKGEKIDLAKLEKLFLAQVMHFVKNALQPFVVKNVVGYLDDTAKTFKEMSEKFVRSAKAMRDPKQFQVEALLPDIRKALAGAITTIQPAAAPAFATTPAKVAAHPKAPVAPARRMKPPANDGVGPVNGEIKLGKAERHILTVLAQYQPNGRTWSQIALMAGYSPRGGGFGNAMRNVRKLGLMEGSDPYRITPAGLEALGDYTPLPLGAELLEYWKKELGKAERQILTALEAAHPNSLTWEEIAAKAGYEPGGGGFGNAMRNVRKLELMVSGSDKDSWKASDSLFE